MQARFTTAVLCAFVLLTAAACGGGGGGDGAKITELEADLASAEAKVAEAAKKAADEEAARKKAEDDAAAAKKKAEDDAAAAKKKADDDAAAAKKKADDDAAAAKKKADDDVAAAKKKADQRIEEAEKQTNVAVRAPLLSGVLGGTLKEAMAAGVRYMPGERRTFTRPSNLPAKGSAPSVPGSWSSASYSGPRGNVGTDTVYLYTNIQAPGSKAFWKMYGESVRIAHGPADALAKPTSFGNGRSLYQNSDDPPEPTSKDDASRGGSYDGYSGTFKCKTGCNIAADNTGVLTFNGDWTFSASLTAKRTSK